MSDKRISQEDNDETTFVYHTPHGEMDAAGSSLKRT